MVCDTHWSIKNEERAKNICHFTISTGRNDLQRAESVEEASLQNSCHTHTHTNKKMQNAAHMLMLYGSGLLSFSSLSVHFLTHTHLEGGVINGIWLSAQIKDNQASNRGPSSLYPQSLYWVWICTCKCTYSLDWRFKDSGCCRWMNCICIALLLDYRSSIYIVLCTILYCTYPQQWTVKYAIVKQFYIHLHNQILQNQSHCTDYTLDFDILLKLIMLCN